MRQIAGTDAGFAIGGIGNPTDGYVGGLEVFAMAGYRNAEIIELATVLAADACGVGEVAGSLDAGKRADLIAVAGDPSNASPTCATSCSCWCRAAPSGRRASTR
ncbi:amidohydrolase family protein [Nonomuraea antimicrobica]